MMVSNAASDLHPIWMSGCQGPTCTREQTPEADLKALEESMSESPRVTSCRCRGHINAIIEQKIHVYIHGLVTVEGVFLVSLAVRLTCSYYWSVCARSSQHVWGGVPEPPKVSIKSPQQVAEEYAPVTADAETSKRVKVGTGVRVLL